MAKASTAVAVPESAEVVAAAQDELERELAQANLGEMDVSTLQIPLLKIGQPLTEEVAEGDARAGSFINALTREDLGSDIQFIVAGRQTGRFFHGDRATGRRARKAYGTKTVPWRDDPFYGQPFTEHPDAEETYSARANAGEIEWGKGPAISTTYDFTGYVISGLEEGEEPIPVCLALMRTNSKQAKKWFTLLDAVLRGKYWDAVFDLSTEQQKNSKGNYYVLNVKMARKTTPEEKQRAVELALVLRSQTVDVVGEADEAKPVAKPSDNGGMAV